MLAAGYGVLAVAAAVVLTLPSAVRAAPSNICDMGVATYAANSTFEANLDRLGAELPANVSAARATGGYAVATVGAAPDLVYALALCRGDVNASACGACVAAAFADGKRSCPGIKGATVSGPGDGCVLRYSGQSFMNFLSTEQWQVSEILYGHHLYPIPTIVSSKHIIIGRINH
jgi:hypothetical protein